MNLFISWSGERSRLLATVLAELLPDILQDVKAWMSEHDINPGSRWGQELNQQLDASNFGILCLTPENIHSPWLLFEAGSIGKSVSEARVIPYRLGLSATDVPFPLAQFQGVDATEGGTRKLVGSLNAGLKQPMERERLDRLFQRWWPDLDARIKAIPPANAPPQKQRTERELLEELLGLVREKVRPAPVQDPDPEAYTGNKVPKSAVWKTLHDLKEADLERLTDEELDLYIAKVHERDLLTPHGGEEYALFQAAARAEQELTRRREQKSPASDISDMK